MTLFLGYTRIEIDFFLSRTRPGLESISSLKKFEKQNKKPGANLRLIES
jgi:hypothetical protein